MIASVADTYYHVTFTTIEEGAAFVAALSRFVASPVGTTPESRTASQAAFDVIAGWPPSSLGLDLYLSIGALEATVRGFGQPPVVTSCTAAELPHGRVSLLNAHDRAACGRDDILQRLGNATRDQQGRT